jgi:hypothetical protein
LGDAPAFLTASSDGVVKPNALDETTIAANALVSHNNIEKRAGFCAAA